MRMTSETSKCWAYALGGCSEKLSREHLVSAALFPDATTVTVSGFPWCAGETKTVGLASLTSKMLCSTHNGCLSPLDSAAGAAFKVFGNAAMLVNRRLATNSPRFKVRHFRINGFLLERWLLKTLINLCRESDLLIGREAQKPGVPEESLVRICFGMECFPGKAGLYLAARTGAKVNSGPVVQFAPLIFDGTHILGGFFHFRGFLLFISLMDEPLPSNFEWISSLDASSEWAGTTPSWHFNKITLTVNQIRSHVIRFNW